MLKKDWHKFPVLFNLYIAQSIPMSFFSTVIPVIMRQEAYSLESIGMFQLVKLPWIAKFLWAPLVDNTAGGTKQLRRWIIFSELFYAAVILGVSMFNLQTDFNTIIVLVILALVASATQDIATDAFAIFILKKKERSVGNGFQSAGSFVGSFFGTGVLLVAYQYLGWHDLLHVLAAFVLLAIIPLWLYKGNLERTETKKRARFLDIFRFFLIPGMGKRALILLTYYSGIIGILTMIKPYLVDLGYTPAQIGLMSGMVGTSVAAGSALIAGFVMRSIGRKTAMVSFAFMGLLAGVYFWFISQGTPVLWQLYAGIILVWSAYGFASVAIYTTSMDVVRKGCEGTDFTVQIVITHLSGIIISILAGRLGDRWGYNGVFAFEIMMSLCALGILWFGLRGLNYAEDR